MRSHAKAPSAGSTHGEFRRSLAGALGVALLASVVLMLGVVVPAASAAPTATSGYSYLTGGEFGAGNVSGFYFNPEANTIATDSHGNIVLLDEYQGRAAAFAPDQTTGGTFLTDFLSGLCRPGDIAIDPNTDALYVQLNVSGPCGGMPIQRFVSDGSPTPTYTLDPGFEAPSASPTFYGVTSGMAVDPTTHDLVVADPATRAIRRYSTTGALVSTISPPSMTQTPAWIAVGLDSSIYVAQQEDPNIVHLSATGVPLGKIAHGAQALAVNPVTGVLVATVGDRLRGLLAER